MIEYVLLAQMAITSPPSNIMKKDVPVYSWEQPSTPPRYQVPQTGIYTDGGSTHVKTPMEFEDFE